jgi:hypothetical protein
LPGDFEVDVLLVGDQSDPHVIQVDGRLAELGARTLRWNLADLRSSEHVAEPGQLAIRVGGSWALVNYRTSAWWHRSGEVDLTDLDPAEAQLVVEEAPILLRGALLAAGVRWIDDPYLIERAENRFAQLIAARALGINTPETRQTNYPPGAQSLRTDGDVVAKPVSPGRGIVPYTDLLADDDFDLLSNNPTFLQQFVVAQADLRVVTVGKQSWVWRYPRRAGVVDWRAHDPVGSGFVLIENQEVAAKATEIAAALHLTMGVSDWLETKSGVVFLEVNPQGGWLFLQRADQLVVPAVADLLNVPVTTGGVSRPGVWPKALRRVFWDLGTAASAPQNDGIVAPTFARPDWIDRVAQLPGALEVAQSANESARSTASVAEEKANRLVQLGLALLALAFAVGAYQITFDLQRSLIFLLTLIPVAAAIISLALATFEAGEIDRVGFYRGTEPSDLDGVGPAGVTTVKLAVEEHGRALARWTAKKKLTDLMQARAWLARGLVALVLAALTAGICRGASTGGSPAKTITTTMVYTLREVLQP